jgi:hypothetical protein
MPDETKDVAVSDVLPAWEQAIPGRRDQDTYEIEGFYCQ